MSAERSWREIFLSYEFLTKKALKCSRLLGGLALSRKINARFPARFSAKKYEKFTDELL